MLYDSSYKDFKGKLRTRWLGPYVIERCHDNGLVQIRTIDVEAIHLLVNGHKLFTRGHCKSKSSLMVSIKW